MTNWPVPPLVDDRHTGVRWQALAQNALGLHPVEPIEQSAPATDLCEGIGSEDELFDPWRIGDE
jgi:hypothetical protein